ETLRSTPIGWGVRPRGWRSWWGSCWTGPASSGGGSARIRDRGGWERWGRGACAPAAPRLGAGGTGAGLGLGPDVGCGGEPSRLEQVLVNLLGNAARHARGAAIQVRLWTLPDETCLEVRDSGPGIPEAVRERLFEPFSRAPGAAPGLGLG